MTEGTEVRFVSSRRDQLAGEVRNWLLDRLRDGHDARPWDQRPAEDQERIIGQAEVFGINLVSDIADAIHEGGDRAIRATISKVTTDGSILKGDVTLPVDDGDDDVHAMVDATGKKVMIIVADPADLTGTEGRPVVADDQGSLELGETEDEEFLRLYRLYDQRECREEDLPQNTWDALTSSGPDGGVDGWFRESEKPDPIKAFPFVLEAKRSVDFETVFDEESGLNKLRIKTFGDWEPPLVVDQWLECEWRYAAVSELPVPDDGLPDDDWQHGQTEVMAGVIWLLEKPQPSEPQPIVVEAWRSVERYDNGKVKSLGRWSVPTEVAEDDETPAGGEVEASAS